MADTTLTQTGAEVQADLDKVEGLANIKSVGSGLTLTSAGEIQVSGGGGTQLYLHTFTFNNVIFNFVSTEEHAFSDYINIDMGFISSIDKIVLGIDKDLGRPERNVIKIYYFDKSTSIITYVSLTGTATLMPTDDIVTAL